MPPPTATPRRRVPASERREALIESAVHEFAQGGLHGTPVDKIARSVGVAQPYVFALFGNKRELFLAAVERAFDWIADAFTKTAEAYEPDSGPPEVDLLKAMGLAYRDLVDENRHYLMLQHQAYAACDDPVIRDKVRQLYAGLVRHVQELSNADTEEIDDFFRYGMWCNVAAAMDVEDMSVASEWVQAELGA